LQMGQNFKFVDFVNGPKHMTVASRCWTGSA